MPDPLSLGLGIVSGLTSLGGLLGGDAARRRADAARQAAINEIARQIDAEYQDTLQNNARGLYAATGQGGDAIQALGRRLGSSLAGAGVYNSSVTAGTLAQAQDAQQANLANLASQDFYNARQLHDQGIRYVGGLKLGLANDRFGQANSDLSGARNGLASFLGSLSQFNLARSGQNQNQNALPRSLGGYGSPSVLAPGAGFNLMNGDFLPQSSYKPFGF